MIQEAIKSAREAKNKRKQDVASSIGMGRNRYSRLESGEAMVRLDELDKVLAELGLEVRPIESISLDQQVIRKIRELKDLIG